VIETFNLDIKQVMETREQSCIGAIIETLAHERYEKQFAIGGYRIDLYFFDLKLAVECDELGHRDRNPTEEVARQTFIETQLGCRFYRFNPDEPNFSVYKTIGDLIRMIYK